MKFVGHKFNKSVMLEYERELNLEYKLNLDFINGFFSKVAFDKFLTEK